ncbi:probable serine/threonine-protein kinase PBL25 [Brachypodium distachyon]|uniref:non-specific serine/threonine protein kinase n=1 Tax=Brachypodium distachyon TaxID=15368 RepID=I1HML1_BRADI|nr:probable serine/threonine-protein kinase PBL25 [Brachypodium distachyon]KQK07863.1 hypothetical protein BRADI_2g38090v3 [Brachypodium distachyon]|eukprot:XP_010233378.1 probable serine/threonine-protein kinase PBL25 [Brachypodium distachyon]
MNCFLCFKPEKKMALRRMEWAGPVANTATSMGSGAPLQESESKEQSSELRANGEPAESSSTAKAAKAFTFRELATATKNFRFDCLIGEGGFGKVYKGQLENGQVVAVKQLDLNGFQGNREFLVEVLMLSLLHHPNLVSLVGYCADGEQRLLVYEYMPLGSLADHLLDLTSDQIPLSWHKRMKIAHGTAKGLEYLHEKANPPVIYRDLKSPNILLDEEYNPKLSDFGLAKLGPVGEKTHISTRVMGTYGYCAPEYIKTGQLTIKTDVYSFGVFLLELITGKRAVDSARPGRDQILINWAKPMIRDRRRYHELVDPLLRGEYAERDLSQAVGVAAMCLEEEDSVRPYMSDAVVALGFLAEAPSGCEETTSTVPQNKLVEDHSLTDSIKPDESTFDRQRAVAEAIEWGAMRHKQKAQIQGKTTQSQCITDPTEPERM